MMATPPPEPILLHGEAVAVLREQVPTTSVDMIYLDPPFGTQVDWHGAAGSFTDKHAWDDDAHAAATELSMAPILLDIAAALPAAGRAYLVKMSRLFVELQRVLKLTGTVWLHCDDSMGHYLRIALALIFGPKHDLGSVVWRRTTAHNSRRSCGRVHDTIYVFARSRAARWRLARIRDAAGARCKERRREGAEGGSPIHDPEAAGESWDFSDGSFVIGDPMERLFVDGYADDLLNTASTERVGYPTQKPLRLLERVVNAGTLPGGVVLDPTCGSGTTVIAAMKLGRPAIGIDRSADALKVAAERIEAAKPRQLGLFGLDAPNPRRAVG